MPGPAASATNVGAGSPRSTSSPRAGGGGGGARQRKGAAGGTGTVRAGGRSGGTSSGGMWRFYTDDSPGIKVNKYMQSFFLTSVEIFQISVKNIIIFLFQVGPVPVLVMSLLFIACVFMLHIWGKYNRA